MIPGLTLVDCLGLIAGCLSVAGPLPQIYKIWKSRSAYDISIMTLIVTYSSTCLNLIYFFMKGDMIPLWTNIIALGFGLLFFTLKIYYG